MQTFNSEIFDLVKIKPFTQLLNMSPSRFTQKLRKYKIKGKEQNFSPEESEKIKQGLELLSSLIKYELTETKK